MREVRRRPAMIAGRMRFMMGRWVLGVMKDGEWAS